MVFYKIRTLDASVILTEGKKKDDSFSFEIDLDNAVLKSDVIIKVENHADCALFRQIRIAAGKEGDSDMNDLFYDLIFVDFTNSFSFKKRGKALMKNGFKLKEKGQKERTFYPLDRSANMSKHGLITFISGDLYDDVDERIRLGINFDEIDVIPSKYFAYRGLYLSDGKPIYSLDLNEKTVIVIDDDKTTFKADVVTCIFRKDENGNLLRNIDGKLPLTNEDGFPTVIKDKEIVIDSFDGEGIVSKEYAETINDELFENENHAYSYQIRMPFVKGVLHTVDFKGFLKDQLRCEDLTGIYINDYFGHKRDITKAEIILTKSMFKASEWVKAAAKDNDQMKFYFDQFRKYDHTLYITNTSRGFGMVEKIPLGYQFLNTLDITSNELMELVKKHYEAAREISEDVELARKKLIGRAASNIDDEGDIDGLDLPAWKYALLQNKAFMYDKYIKKYSLEKMSGHMINQGRIGRIDVDGIIGFLSRDLLAFMVHLMKTLDGISTDDAVERVQNEYMDIDHFYIAEHKKTLKKNQCYGILRNPHLSRNEQCALKSMSPNKQSLYNKYFSDLTGVIMIPYGSVAHDVLGGADFDGDTVKLFTEKIINKAILRGAYKDKDLQNKKYPIAKIPSPEGRLQKVRAGKGEMVEFDQIEKAFANKIGYISNAALMIAKHEYVEKRVDYENWSALCTIATGLEIDAVKTGERPALKEIKKRRGKEEDAFLKIKYKMSDMDDEVGDDQDDEIEDDQDDKIEEGGKKKKAYYPKPEEQGYRPIDYLEYYYQNEKKKNKKNNNKQEKLAGEAKTEKPTKKEPTKKDARRMMFVDEITQKKPDKTDERIEKIKRIRGSYEELEVRVKELKNQMLNYDTAHCVRVVKFILNTKYDQKVEMLPRSGEEINIAIDKAIRECKEQLYDPKKARYAYAKLYDNWKDWIFCEGYDNKLKMLSDILGDIDVLNEATLEILCDTYDNGYHILKHILRYVLDSTECEFGMLASIKSLRDTNRLSDAVKKKYKEIDEELFGRMCDIYDIKKSKAQLEQEATELIRQKISEMFRGDMKTAAEFFLVNDNLIDPQHICLWNWFNAEEIKHLIKENPEGSYA